MKDIRVRVYTLLSGPCTNGTMIKSTTYTELVQKPPNTGQSLRFYRCVVKKNIVIRSWLFWKMYELTLIFLLLGVGGIKVEDFICMFSNMERMECNWRRNPQMPANSQQYLYFWCVMCPTKTITLATSAASSS